MAELSEKQKRFCEKYLECNNASEAAIFAGYSKKTARSQGSRLLTDANISAFIKENQKRISTKLGISFEWVLQRFKDISDRCMQAVPVMVFDPDQKRMVQKTDDDGNGVWEFDSSGANKATENIGKHIGFYEADNEQSRPINLIEATNFKIERRKK